MKATMSQDGQMRFTVKVPFRVASHDLIDAIGWNITRNNLLNTDGGNLAMAVEMALKGFKSRKNIMAALTDAIQSDGENFWVWADSQGQNASSKIREQAAALVAKKFPELKTTKPQII